MSTEAQAGHSEADEALEQLKRFSSVLEDSMAQSDTASFTGTDEEKTVSATINGHRALTSLFVEDGLLRLGAETVEERINEALTNAQLMATEAIAAKQQGLLFELIDATTNLAKSIGLFDEPKEEDE